MRHARILASLLFAAAAVLADAASAQTYPSRPITLIVPFPPGGATDAIARIVQDSMSQSLGQPIVIENIGGAGGTIAAARAARAAPDGHTVLLHQVALAASATLYPKLTFDADKDFLGIGLVNNSATMIVGRGTLPANNVAELVHWLKEPGRNAKMGHAGVGAFSHLCGVLLAQEVGAQIDQIPYRGGGPALNDVIAGHADLTCLAAALVAELINTGKLKGYGIMGKQRFAGLPRIESMSEAGYQRLDLPFWHALFVPAGTPRPIVDKLNDALRQSFVNAKVGEAFVKNGMELFPAAEQTPEAATAMLKNEIKRWGEVIRANNITAQ